MQISNTLFWEFTIIETSFPTWWQSIISCRDIRFTSSLVISYMYFACIGLLYNLYLDPSRIFSLSLFRLTLYLMTSIFPNSHIFNIYYISAYHLPVLLQKYHVFQIVIFSTCLLYYSFILTHFTLHQFFQKVIFLLRANLGLH